MYHKDTVYNGERPTYTLSVITQTGKHGTFTCKRSTGEMTPIAWTFEGGGGNSLFIITPTYNLDTKTWSTDRTWDEVKAAVAKSENPNDYSISWDKYSLLPPNELVVTKNNSGEIENVQMLWTITSPMVIDKDRIPYEFGGGCVPVNKYVTIKYNASSSNIEFTYAHSGEVLQALISSVTVTNTTNGIPICDPPNVVETYGSIFDPNNLLQAQFICPLYYNGETYHFETSEKDSSNIPSLYFSTVSNGVYKRLKITQGQNDAADTVVMDKETKLSDEPLIVDITFERGKYYSNATAGTIYNAAASGQRVITNNGLSLMYYKMVPAKPPTSGPTYSLLFFGCGNSFENKDSFQAVVISCVDKDDSFIGEWTGYYVNDLTNPLGLRNSQVGQIAEISGVDSNGKPTSWKTVDVLTTTNTAAFTPTADYHPATKKYVDDHTPSKISKLENDSNYITAAHVYDGILISSSTPNSTKKFKITVDDTGALTATGVTEA